MTKYFMTRCNKRAGRTNEHNNGKITPGMNVLIIIIYHCRVNEIQGLVTSVFYAAPC